MARQKKSNRTARLFGLGVVGFGLVVFLVEIAVGGYLFTRYINKLPPKPTSGTLTLGEPVQLTAAMIGPSGGSIVIDDPGSELDGLHIEIPEGAYVQNTFIHIEAQPIEGHTFGDFVRPITPLIKIYTEGNVFAYELITITIPIQITEGDFAMAFAYDEQKGVLEGMTLLEETLEFLKVTTRFISRDVLVSAIPEAFLEGDVDTGFEHGVDDWQFTNYGSVIAPGGHCAGQSLSAMFYYIERLGPRLYGQYDNYDNYFQDTPTLEFDDTLAYRLASVTQESIDWESSSRKFWLRYQRVRSDRVTYNLFAYSMMVTGAPQYVGIYREGGGHAMIIYRKVGDTFYVSDPNYPKGSEGGGERVITFNRTKGEFDPYYSGPSAADLGHAYPVIYYFGYRDIINWDTLHRLWREMKAGVVGEVEFPIYELAITEEGPEERLWFNHEAESEKVSVRVRDASFRPRLVVYNSSLEVIGDSESPIQLTLTEGNNYLGFLVLAIEVDSDGDEQLQWVGFEWIKIVYKEKPASIFARATKTPMVQYGVFIAGNDVIVGIKEEIESTPTCNLVGWGVDCSVTVGEATSVTMVLGPFSSYDQAVEAYCENLDPESVYYPPLVVGTKGKFMGEDRWISNAPSCP
ncbi:MAG: hypothetical protein AB1345_14360 [Chloroflexota bacterium]